MLYATAFVMHQLIICNKPSEVTFQRSVMLAIAVLLFSVVHCILNDLNLHSLVFASMITYIARRTSKMIKNNRDRGWQKKARKWTWIGSGEFDMRVLPHHDVMRRMLIVSGCCVLGYGLWLIDMFCCPTLRSWRRQIGLPWGFLLELHGW